MLIMKHFLWELAKLNPDLIAVERDVLELRLIVM